MGSLKGAAHHWALEFAAREGQPLSVEVVRWRCPHCPRSYAQRRGAVAHMARCWYRPENRGCKTCKHFVPPDYEGPEACNEGIDLDGANDPQQRPGPIIGCTEWAAK